MNYKKYLPALYNMLEPMFMRYSIDNEKTNMAKYIDLTLTVVSQLACHTT